MHALSYHELGSPAINAHKGTTVITREQIDSVLKEADHVIGGHVRKLGPLAGLAVGIVHGGNLIYTYGSGFADLKTQTPVNADTIFRIMSISKTFTAVALMQLWEQGKFQLDDPANAHLRTLRVEHPDLDAPPITIRHLLTHTSGIGELRKIKPRWLLRPETMVLEDLSVRDGARIPSLAEYYGGKVRAEVHPGVKWAYSNHAFGVLGQLVADLSGEPFEQYAINYIFKPLGMEQADWFLSDRVRARLATGYIFQKDSFRTVEEVYGYQHVVTAGASNIYASVNDMARYAAALMSGNGSRTASILKPETLQLMFEPHYRLDPRLPGQGLAFFLDEIGTHRTVGHGGGWPGFISSLLVAPDDGLAVLVFTNTSNSTPGVIAYNLLRRLLGVVDPKETLEQRLAAEHPHLWASLCGSYGPRPGPNTNFRHWEGTAAELEVFVEGNHLALRSSAGAFQEPVQLHPVESSDPLSFEIIMDERVHQVVFKRNEEGYIDRLQMWRNNFLKKPGPADLPLANVVHEITSQTHRRGASLILWYLRGMPDRLKAGGRLLLAMVILFVFWRRK
jgi:CubicO group peptidase (beta-lactamase class C family)